MSASSSLFSVIGNDRETVKLTNDAGGSDSDVLEVVKRFNLETYSLSSLSVVNIMSICVGTGGVSSWSFVDAIVGSVVFASSVNFITSVDCSAEIGGSSVDCSADKIVVISGFSVVIFSD